MCMSVRNKCLVFSGTAGEETYDVNKANYVKLYLTDSNGARNTEVVDLSVTSH